jgi:glycine cleavage system H protein
MDVDSLPKCVWMSAGLVTYKLCDRDYECHLCPFDQAMRGEGEDMSLEDLPPPQVELSNFYHPCHVWIKVETPEKVVMGIDGLLSTILCHINSVILPNSGDTFSKNDTLCHIVERRGIVPLLSPISGTVISTNIALKKRPELLIQDPFKGGFLLKMKPKNLEKDIRDLFYGEKAIEWLKKEQKRVFNVLSFITERKDLGKTMQDGGKKVISFVCDLTEKDYVKLIEHFMRLSR